MAHAEDKTTIRPNRDGETTIKVSFWSFPSDVHEMMKDMADKDEPVYAVYSHAIHNLRRDYDSKNKKVRVKLKHSPSEAGGRNVWLFKAAHQDMVFLAEKLDCSYADVCYTAALRYLTGKP